MMYFWIVSVLTFVMALICIVINNAQYQIIKQLIVFLTQTVKQSLIKNGEPDKARMISQDEIPKLKVWYNECLNYGLINILALGSTIGLIMNGALYPSLSLLIVMLSAMFLMSNIFFFPRALSRLNKAIEINNKYVLLLKVFERANEKDKR